MAAVSVVLASLLGALTAFGAIFVFDMSWLMGVAFFYGASVTALVLSCLMVGLSKRYLRLMKATKAQGRRTANG